MSDTAETVEVKGFDAFPMRLGDLMRGERATLGKSLLDVQRELRIKAAYIAAIENCDISAFQTPGFIAGYVRSYARYLSLDPVATFEQFCAESGFDGVHADVTRRPARKRPDPAPKPKPARPRDGVAPFRMPHAPRATVADGMMATISPSALGSVAVLCVLIVGIGYGAWALLQDIQRVEFVPAGETGVDPVAVAPVVPGEGDEAVAARAQTYPRRELDVPVMTSRDGPISTLDPDKVGALITDNGSQMARETAARLEAAMPRVTAPAPPRVAVIARRPAWIRVSGSDGTVLFEKILDGGESFLLPEVATGATLRAGNSGAVYLSLDGAPFGPIGDGTNVVKDIVLGPEAVARNFARVEDKDALDALDSPRVITMNDR